MSDLFEKIIEARGLVDEASRRAFLYPDYDSVRHDPFLLPDMDKAVERLVLARERQERITIYGDYDIDGLTATTVLLDALRSFGFARVDTFIPNRFVEGYGLTSEAIKGIATAGADLIITVDCGSLSTKEIEYANSIGVDIIVTDHHNVLAVQPPAIAVINPKRLLMDYPDEYEGLRLKSTSTMMGVIYPFLDLAGVGVAFKLVQALQTRLDGLPLGHEKWLLDLVALGTVCDIVTLVDENRANVFWGLKVLAKTRRPGLRALMAVSGVEQIRVNARSLGFGLGPRMNAAGRLETAQVSLDMLIADDPVVALERAQELDALNTARRSDQDKIYKEAVEKANTMVADSVLVVSDPGWNHGIIGIVAAKLLEKYKKPTFILQEMGEESKGSARSYGNFSAADAIRSADGIITKGGGHKAAAGVTLPTGNIHLFREQVNKFYNDEKLSHDEEVKSILPKEDAIAVLGDVDELLIEQISTLEPFGSGNAQPILLSENLLVRQVRRMGGDGQHVKLELEDDDGVIMQFLAFSAPEHFFVELGQRVDAWYQPDINEWQGRRSVEGRLLHLSLSAGGISLEY